MRPPNWLRVLWLRACYWPTWDVIHRVRRAVKVQKAGFYIVSCDELLAITKGLDEHPEGWDYPCNCKECLSYAD